VSPEVLQIVSELQWQQSNIRGIFWMFENRLWYCLVVCFFWVLNSLYFGDCNFLISNLFQTIVNVSDDAPRRGVQVLFEHQKQWSPPFGSSLPRARKCLVTSLSKPTLGNFSRVFTNRKNRPDETWRPQNFQVLKSRFPGSIVKPNFFPRSWSPGPWQGRWARASPRSDRRCGKGNTKAPRSVDHILQLPLWCLVLLHNNNQRTHARTHASKISHRNRHTSHVAEEQQRTGSQLFFLLALSRPLQLPQACLLRPHCSSRLLRDIAAFFRRSSVRPSVLSAEAIIGKENR